MTISKLFSIKGYEGKYWESIDLLIAHVLTNGIDPSAEIIDEHGDSQGLILEYIVF